MGMEKMSVAVAEEMFGMVRKNEVWVHKQEKCAGQFCSIHNPSVHPLSNAQRCIRLDRGGLIERLCQHGVGHPDPDSIAHFAAIDPDWAKVYATHGCDGCCRG